jgi:hypothetical protein
MSAAQNQAVGVHTRLDEAERAFEQQRTNPGELRYGPFSYAGMAVGFVVSMVPLSLLSWLVTRPARPYVPQATVPYNLGPPMLASTTGHGECEVRRITLAFDARARRALQQSLDQIADNVDMNTPHGLLLGAQQARNLLRAAVGNAAAAYAVSHRASVAQAERVFVQTCDDLNRRYDQATISNHRRTEPPEVTARREEGDGFVVVSIVVGINGSLPQLSARPTRSSISQALADLLPRRADDLASLEVIWSPSIDQDRLSSAEMAVLYPELVSLAEAAPMGRVVCNSCHNIYAKELGGCPLCGAQQSTAATLSSTQQAQLASGASSAHTISCPFCRKPTPSYEVQCQHCGGRVKN